jgi:RNA methyltransferase, TrmH family
MRASDRTAGVDIASAANPRIKAAVRLRERRERERTGRTIVDGAREILRALDARVPVDAAFVCEPLVRSADAHAALSRLRDAGSVLLTTSPVVFDKLAFGDRVDGILAIVEVPPTALDRLRLPADPLVVVIEGVEKPGNLGAILRTADGAGVDALLVASPRTDVFNPNTIRASLGTVFTVPLAVAPTDAVMAFLQQVPTRIVAARVDADVLYTDVDLRGPVAVAAGNEAGGLTAAWSGPNVTAVRLPMLGAADSLNVSAAAAILLYEARRQRGIPGQQRERMRPR